MRVAVDVDFKARVDLTDFRVSDWLALGGSKYAVGQLDLINAVHQIDQMIDDLAVAPTEDSPIEVPAMLESGLSVICGDLGDVLRRRFARQRDIENGIDSWLGGAATPPPVLFAEDITARLPLRRRRRGRPRVPLTARPAGPGGVRVPAGQDPRGRATRRRGLGVDRARRPTEPRTAGPYPRTSPTSRRASRTSTRSSSTTRPSGASNDHVFTWGGWSLSTPRVGNSTTGRGTVKRREVNVPAPGSPTQLVVDYAHVNGTLPKLRYGRTYTLRAVRRPRRQRPDAGRCPPARRRGAADALRPAGAARGAAAGAACVAARPRGRRPARRAGDPQRVGGRGPGGGADRPSAVPAPDQPEPAGAPRPAGRRQRPGLVRADRRARRAVAHRPDAGRPRDQRAGGRGGHRRRRRDRRADQAGGALPRRPGGGPRRVRRPARRRPGPAGPRTLRHLAGRRGRPARAAVGRGRPACVPGRAPGDGAPAQGHGRHRSAGHRARRRAARPHGAGPGPRPRRRAPRPGGGSTRCCRPAGWSRSCMPHGCRSTPRCSA